MQLYVIQQHGRLNKYSGVTRFDEVYSCKGLREKNLILLDPLADANLPGERPRVGCKLRLRPLVKGLLDADEELGPLLWDSELNVALDFLFEGYDVVFNLAAERLGEEGSDL